MDAVDEHADIMDGWISRFLSTTQKILHSAGAPGMEDGKKVDDQDTQHTNTSDRKPISFALPTSHDLFLLDNRKSGEISSANRQLKQGKK